jgi:hypothetical protein
VAIIIGALCMVTVRTASTSAIAIAMPTIDGISFQSASRPPTKAPAVMPTPKPTRIHAIHEDGTPVTSVRIGAMKVNTLKAAAEIRTVIDIAISTCGFRMTRNSVARSARSFLRFRGTNSAMAATAAMPMPATTKKVARQPSAWPRAVPPGTPMMLATVSPAKTSAMALARRFGATRSAATTAAMPKKAAWAKAVKTRAPISSS